MKKLTMFMYIFVLSAAGVLTAYVPAAGGLIAIAVAAGVCVLAYLGGAVMALVPGAVACIVFSFLHDGSAEAMLLLLGFTLPGLMMAAALRNRARLRWTSAAGAVGFLAQSGASFFYIKSTTGVNVFAVALEELQKALEGSRGELAKRLAEAGYGGSQEALDMLMQTYDMVFEVFRLLTPAFIVLAAAVSAYLAVVLAMFLLGRHGAEPAQIISFREIRGSRGLVLSVPALLLLSAGAGGAVANVFINIAFLVLLFFVVCGLALADDFLFLRFKNTFVRVLILGGFIALTMGMSALSPVQLANPLFVAMLAGMADAAFNLRRYFARGDELE